MTDNRVTSVQSRGCRPPSSFESIFEKLVGGRILIPNGNCRHGAKSRGVVYEIKTPIWHDDIMRELVLCYYLGNKPRIDLVFRFGTGPSEDLVEPGMAIDLGRNNIELRLT